MPIRFRYLVCVDCNVREIVGINKKDARSLRSKDLSRILLGKVRMPKNLPKLPKTLLCPKCKKTIYVD